MMNFLFQMLDRGLQRNPLWQEKRFGRILPSGDKSIKAHLIAERKTKKKGSRVEKPSKRRNPILLIECFLKTRGKRKIAIKEKYKVRALKPLKGELGSSVFLEGGLRWQRQ